MDNDIEITELKISGERTKQGYIMRRSVIETRKALTPDMQRAFDEICRAYKIIAGRPMAGTTSYTGGAGDGDEAWQQDQINRLDVWAKHIQKMPKGGLLYNIAIDVCAFDSTARQVAEQRGCDHKTVMTYLRCALNEYCILRGWGNQISKKGID